MAGVFELIEEIIAAITNVISAMGYWGVFFGMAIESANIPLPSEVILTFGGYLVSIGRLEFYRTVMAGTLGGMLGSVLSYYLGVWGGRPFLAKYGKYVGFSMQHLDLAEKWFAKYGEATVFFTRMLPIIRTFISLPAGIAKMHFGKFLLYSFLGSLPWSLLLVYIGLKLGENWQLVETWFHRLDVVLVLVIIIIIIAYFWRKRRQTTWAKK